MNRFCGYINGYGVVIFNFTNEELFVRSKLNKIEVSDYEKSIYLKRIYGQSN